MVETELCVDETFQSFFGKTRVWSREYEDALGRLMCGNPNRADLHMMTIPALRSYGKAAGVTGLYGNRHGVPSQRDLAEMIANHLEL